MAPCDSRALQPGRRFEGGRRARGQEVIPWEGPGPQCLHAYVPGWRANEGHPAQTCQRQHVL